MTQTVVKIGRLLCGFWKGALAIKIALCDDERAQRVQTEAFLRDYNSRHPDINLTVAAFPSGAALLEHMRLSGAFDIYLLDVIMPGESGIELGLSIRELDQGGHIIYLTASPDFAVDSYRARASDYLLKPLEPERLFQALGNVLERMTQEYREYVTIKTREGLRRLSLCSVVHGELVRRCVQYHLSDGSVVEGMSLRGSFQEAVRPLLAHPRFLLCGTSFFVNLTFVERIGPSELRLTGGGTLPLSRLFRADVTQRWMDYYLEQGGQHGRSK